MSPHPNASSTPHELAQADRVLEEHEPLLTEPFEELSSGALTHADLAWLPGALEAYRHHEQQHVYG